MFWFRAGALCWHQGIIPSDEIWLKVGGDKGGSTFKLSVQLANALAVNSINNTYVITCYQGTDTLANLQVAISRYREQLQELVSTGWKYEIAHLWFKFVHNKMSCLKGTNKFEYFCLVITSFSARCMGYLELQVNLHNCLALVSYQIFTRCCLFQVDTVACGVLLTTKAWQNQQQ